MEAPEQVYQEHEEESGPNVGQDNGKGKAEGPITPLDQLRAEFAKEADKPRLFRRLPARGGKLVAEYAPIGRDTAKAAVEADSDADLITSSVVRILRYDPSHPSQDERGLVPLGVWADRPELDPLQFDHRFADLLGLPKSDPNTICLAMFEGNTLAMSAQAAIVGEWSSDTRQQQYQDFKIRSQPK